MTKSFLKIFGVSILLLFQFTSCLDDDDKRSVFLASDEPVVYAPIGEYPFVRNESHLFYVPGLAENTTLKADDLLWSSFIVDLEDSEGYPSTLSQRNYIARRFSYQIVDSTRVIIPADREEFESYLKDDYSASIKLAVLYKHAVDSLWFFGFEQAENNNQSYTYELILNPEIENNNRNPTLYIRSKAIDSSTDGMARDQSGKRIFAFDVTEFVKYYRDAISSSEEMVRFYLKYKTGTDAAGKDIYREFMSNPISWEF
jgi:hypothetical protein